MRRLSLFAGLCVVALAGAFAARSLSVGAAGKAGKPDGPDPAVATLPVGQVVLYSSGVGYFQREGSVDGSARLDLSFPVTDINDLIKSMVLRDLDGGHVGAVSYESNAPLDRTLRSFAVNLTGNPGLAQILDQARGQRVEVSVSNAAALGLPGANLSGTVVGVERRVDTVGKDRVEGSFLNLWCADGVRSVRLADVQRLRFTNAALEGEFRKALDALGQGRQDAQRKAVSIQFTGEGKRRVRVGYVVENPIWKASYRLVLDKAGAPYLQGWAVVDNSTDEDWRDVRMALISGRPISFQMDLYTPLYVPRPTVVPELFASLRPVAYSGSVTAGTDRTVTFSDGTSNTLGLQLETRRRALKDSDQDKKEEAARPAGGARADRAHLLRLESELKGNLALGGSVTTAASAGKLGDYFQYLVERPVSLPRQKSALLPIVGKEVQARRVSIYNQAVQGKHPLLGLRFKNTSGVNLMQGPVTVFEGSTYAGDARVLDLQPDEERLLSYAVDLGTEVEVVPHSDDGRITHLRAFKGVLHTTTKVKETRTYKIKNRSDAARTVLVEHPVRHDFKLTGAKPQESASDFHRFDATVPAGGTKSVVVAEERDVGSTVQILGQGDERVRFFINQPAITPAVKKGLEEAIRLRVEVDKARREIQEQERQLRVLTDDQARVRANLRELPRGTQAYDRAVAKIDDHETKIEGYQTAIKRLQGQEHSRNKAFLDFLASFTAE